MPRKEVISVSLDPDQLRQLEALRLAQGLDRSKVIRAALTEHLARLEHEPSGVGPASGVILCLYRHEAQEEVARIIRGAPVALRNLVHSHGEGATCLDVAHVEGPADAMRGLVHLLRTAAGVRSVQVVVLGERIPGRM